MGVDAYASGYSMTVRYRCPQRGEDTVASFELNDLEEESDDGGYVLPRLVNIEKCPACGAWHVIRL